MIPDYHMAKPSSTRFQVWFSAHHKDLLKTNEIQLIITKKLNPVFQEKNHHRLLWFQ